MAQAWTTPRWAEAPEEREPLEVSFHTAPSPQAIPWCREDEARVTALVRACLGTASGSWRVTLTFSGVLARTWIVECQRSGKGRTLRMLVDPARRVDVDGLRTALASLDAAAGRPGSGVPSSPLSPTRRS